MEGLPYPSPIVREVPLSTELLQAFQHAVHACFEGGGNV